MFPKNFNCKKGFSLIEILIVIAVAGILLVIITRFLKDSKRIYNLQEELTERDQNAQYALKRLAERLMEAGAGLPTTGYAIINTSGNPVNSFTVATNPRGGQQIITNTIVADSVIPADDTLSFEKTDSVLIVPKNPITPLTTCPFKRAGLKSGNFVIVTTIINTLQIGDMVYGLKKENYNLTANNLCLENSVLAENIDSLAILFNDIAGNPTSTWTNMRSAKITVRARTQHSFPNMPGDGYLRRQLSIEVGFRNKN